MSGEGGDRLGELIGEGGEVLRRVEEERERALKALEGMGPPKKALRGLSRDVKGLYDGLVRAIKELIGALEDVREGRNAHADWREWFVMVQDVMGACDDLHKGLSAVIPIRAMVLWDWEPPEDKWDELVEGAIACIWALAPWLARCVAWVREERRPDDPRIRRLLGLLESMAWTLGPLLRVDTRFFEEALKKAGGG